MPDSRSVSIIIPTRNSARTLEACLVSCRAQSVPVEIIVVDNVSTDATKAIAGRHADRVADFGPERSAQRNEGVRLASGAHVAIIDSDMVLGPNVIEECLTAMSRPEVAGVVIPEESFGEGFWAECKALERSYYQGVPWMEAARFFRREDFLAAGGYDVGLTGPEDWAFSQRMAARGRLERVAAKIRHDEGRLELGKLLRKKSYYAARFSAYAAMPEHRGAVAAQASIVGRYRLFLSRPGRLFSRPLVGLGMIFMKTCEFGAGAYGMARGRLGRSPKSV